MGFRYHRSRQLFPGVRLNSSKSGLSISLGGKGARVNIGPKGVRSTVGLPGSGMSYVKQASWSRINAVKQRAAIDEAVNARRADWRMDHLFLLGFIAVLAAVVVLVLTYKTQIMALLGTHE